ncbi:MAG: helix-turn-helix domain-containing protein [Culicoidibacterales bacterium]
MKNEIEWGAKMHNRIIVQIQLLTTLYAENRIFTTEELAKCHRISTNTVRKYLAEMQGSLPYNWKIQGKKGEGTILEKPDYDSLAYGESYLWVNEPFFNILVYLLVNGKVTIKKLKEKLFLSQKVVIQALDRIEIMGKANNVELERTPFLRIRSEYESTIRVFFFTMLNLVLCNEITSTRIIDQIPYLKEYKKMARQSLKLINRPYIWRVVFLAAISKIRIKQGHEVKNNLFESQVKLSENLEGVEDVSHFLKRMPGAYFSEGDISFIIFCIFFFENSQVPGQVTKNFMEYNIYTMSNWLIELISAETGGSLVLTKELKMIIAFSIQKWIIHNAFDFVYLDKSQELDVIEGEILNNIFQKFEEKYDMRITKAELIQLLNLINISLPTSEKICVIGLCFAIGYTYAKYIEDTLMLRFSRNIKFIHIEKIEEIKEIDFIITDLWAGAFADQKLKIVSIGRNLTQRDRDVMDQNIVNIIY